jgi:hypothetical protein
MTQPRWRSDVAASVAYLAAAVVVLSSLWAAPHAHVAPYYQTDPAQHKWFLVHGARVVTGLDNPFFTDLLNVPDGVNLMANTSILGLSVPLMTVTLLFGPDVSFVVLLTLGLAGTAFAWYWVLSRHVVSSRWAAAVGGAFCGFGPGIVSHANWHSNFVAQFLVPFIALRLVRLGESGRTVRNGAVLGLLATWQAFINEELLLFTAMACGVFLSVWVVQHWDLARARVRTFAAGLGVAGLVAATLLAYPIWFQFFGPQHYRGLAPMASSMHADLASYVAFSSESLAGDRGANALIAPNYSEENTFLGWPLIALLVLVVSWLWQDTAVRALAVTAVVFAALSLGPRVYINDHRTSIPGPWRLFDQLPLLNSVLPARFGLVVNAIVGILLAFAVDTFLVRFPTAGVSRPVSAWLRGAGAARLLGAGALAAALVPILPTPLVEVGQAPVPRFIVDGGWRSYVHAGQTLVPVPIPSPQSDVGMRWAAAAKLEFAIPRGYFLAPRDGDTGDHAQFGAPPRKTATLLAAVANSGKVPAIGAVQREHAIRDLTYWRAAVVVLDPYHRHTRALGMALTELLGPGTRVDDVWIWDVRSRVG